MMSGPYIQVDETPIKYLDPAAWVTCGWRIGRGKASRWICQVFGVRPIGRENEPSLLFVLVLVVENLVGRGSKP
jgi:hypothetical protein